MTSALNFPARASLIDGIDGRGLDGEGRAADDAVERTEAMLPPLKKDCFIKYRIFHCSLRNYLEICSWIMLSSAPLETPSTSLPSLPHGNAGT